MTEKYALAPSGATLMRRAEKLEQPPEHDVAFVNEMIRQEKKRGHSSVVLLMHQLRLVDNEYVPAAASVPVAEQDDGKALERAIEKAVSIMVDTDRAVAKARAEWADPATVGQRVEKAQQAGAAALLSHYEATRRMAAEFVKRRRPPPPAPDDVVALELGEGVVRNFLPDACGNWFIARYYERHRAWPLLRQIVLRLAVRPPAHLADAHYRELFAQLAELPAHDPHAVAREAREHALSVVDRLRRKIEAWSVKAAQAKM